MFNYSYHFINNNDFFTKLFTNYKSSLFTYNVILCSFKNCKYIKIYWKNNKSKAGINLLKYLWQNEQTTKLKANKVVPKELKN